MPSQGNLLGVPPPAALFDASIEDVIDASKVVATRSGVVTDLGAWISGDPGGANFTQPGRFTLYSHDVALDRPLALLVRSVEGEVNGANPETRCPKLPVETAGVNVVAGTTYWVGIHVGTTMGTGEWEMHGGADVAFRGQKNTGVVYPNTPALWPAGGTTFAGTGAAIGFVYTQNPTIVTGAICGTFKCGTKKAGELNFPFNQAILQLNAHPFQVIEGEFIEVKILVPAKLILQGKPFSIQIDYTAVAAKPQLLLKGQPAQPFFTSSVSMNKASLILRGKAFALQAEATLPFLKPQLILVAGLTEGSIPSLIPTVPVDVILTPTSPIDTLILVPTVPEDLDLSQTTPQLV